MNEKRITNLSRISVILDKFVDDVSDLSLKLSLDLLELGTRKDVAIGIAIGTIYVAARKIEQVVIESLEQGAQRLEVTRNIISEARKKVL